MPATSPKKRPYIFVHICAKGADLWAPMIAQYVGSHVPVPRYMLVVPNRYCSVYTRLWCGYEAYLAAEGHKTIRTARRSIKRQARGGWKALGGTGEEDVTRTRHLRTRGVYVNSRVSRPTTWRSEDENMYRNL